MRTSSTLLIGDVAVAASLPCPRRLLYDRGRGGAHDRAADGQDSDDEAGGARERLVARRTVTTPAMRMTSSWRSVAARGAMMADPLAASAARIIITM